MNKTFTNAIVLAVLSSLQVTSALNAQSFNSGYAFSTRLCNGALYVTGSNSYGQHGNGTSGGNASTPTLVSSLNSGVTQVSGGGSHCLALKSDGSAWAWGWNNFGQLGIGNTTDSNVPVQVSGLTNVSQIYAGSNHNMALKSDGSVWTWGSNGSGQLGNNTTNSSSTPIQVTGISNVSKIAAGRYHCLALKNDGTLWVWGSNAYGQLGNGTTTQSKVPIQISLTNVVQIAAGEEQSLALKSDGTVWAWGYNNVGQLGNGNNTTSNVPVQVSSLSGITDISTLIGDHCVALKNDGTVWAWGYNFYGQLGNNTNTSSNVPVQVSGLTNVTDVEAGGNHCLAMKNDGSIWAWGGNVNGELGDGSTLSKKTPVPVGTLCNFTIGIEENQIRSAFMVYPNPSNGILNIKSENADLSYVEIYNTLGEKVLSASLSENNNALELRQLAKGVYIYIVYSKNTFSQSGKFTIQ
ncbi:MAG: rcc [Bacteroidetes bacterium]|nr:rcc [Bacteroidota bacterium]